MKTNIDKINSFWIWFQSVADDLLKHPTNENLISLLNARITELGVSAWEIGPWENNDYFLVISPGLDINQLPLTQQIIDLAPICNGWHFLAFKPVKDWKGIWDMKNEWDKTIRVNSTNWEYILYLFDDGTFDIDIKIDGVDGNENTRYAAVHFALAGYLGEEVVMQLILNVKIVDSFKGKATSLKHIKKHIESII
ncbi:hypothetical protein [Mucilaginibacter flavus]|uniref:hypothetical protein n=1 Tax=Mucilaginibacter flavus TaxID=931504 RepID=UPI0025B5FE4C|nr:hypothetical protein [Mucilaginibacter flavus]MDN3579658.1 hypothetical protein [Mucilaginibacter flavus]